MSSVLKRRQLPDTRTSTNESSLARLEELTAKDEPLFMFISLTAPHVDDETGDTVQCARHAESTSLKRLRPERRV